jgi:hypothetical protein
MGNTYSLSRVETTHLFMEAKIGAKQRITTYF